MEKVPESNKIVFGNMRGLKPLKNTTKIDYLSDSICLWFHFQTLQNIAAITFRTVVALQNPTIYPDNQAAHQKMSQVLKNRKVVLSGKKRKTQNKKELKTVTFLFASLYLDSF